MDGYNGIEGNVLSVDREVIVKKKAQYTPETIDFSSIEEAMVVISF